MAPAADSDDSTGDAACAAEGCGDGGLYFCFGGVQVNGCGGVGCPAMEKAQGESDIFGDGVNDDALLFAGCGAAVGDPVRSDLRQLKAAEVGGDVGDVGGGQSVMECYGKGGLRYC